MGCCGLCSRLQQMQPIPISTTCKSDSPMHRLPIPVLWVQQILHCALLGLWTMVCWAAYTDTEKKKWLPWVLTTEQDKRSLSSVSDQSPASWCPANIAEPKEPSTDWKQPQRPCSGTQPSLRPKEGEKWSETKGFGILVRDLYLPPLKYFNIKSTINPQENRTQQDFDFWQRV